MSFFLHGSLLFDSCKWKVYTVQHLHVSWQLNAASEENKMMFGDAEMRLIKQLCVKQLKDKMILY